MCRTEGILSLCKSAQSECLSMSTSTTNLDLAKICAPNSALRFCRTSDGRRRTFLLFVLALYGVNVRNGFMMTSYLLGILMVTLTPVNSATFGSRKCHSYNIEKKLYTFT